MANDGPVRVVIGEVKVKVDNQRLAQVLRGPDGPVYRKLLRVGDLVKQSATEKVGVKTGRLRSTIVKRVDVRGKRIAVFVSANTPYALYHHEGGQPHLIRGNPLLVFFWPKVGRVVAFRSVHHPGNRPNRFLTEALAEVVRREF